MTEHLTETLVDLEVLTRAFPASAIKQREGGGGRMLDYVEGHTVIHRLNEATGNCWDLSITKLEFRPEVTIAHVALTLPGLGTREHIGIQESRGGGGDLVKGAVTDAIKKAATLFGVGLELYGPDYEAGEVDAPRQARAAAAPSRFAPAAAAQPNGEQGGISQGQSKNLYRLFKELERQAADEGTEFTKDMYRATLQSLGLPSDDRKLTKEQATLAINHFKALAGEPVEDEVSF